MSDSRRIGVLTLVEPGVSVWSSTRKDRFENPLGGVVVEIDDVPDSETGEVQRFFLCLDPYGGGPVKVHRLAESEVTAQGVEATADSRLTNLIKRLAKEIAEMKGSYLDLRHSERVRWMHRLTGVVTLVT